MMLKDYDSPWSMLSQAGQVTPPNHSDKSLCLTLTHFVDSWPEICGGLWAVVGLPHPFYLQEYKALLGDDGGSLSLTKWPYILEGWHWGGTLKCPWFIPWKLTCPPKRNHFKRKLIFQPLFLGAMLNFTGSTSFFSLENFPPFAWLLHCRIDVKRRSEVLRDLRSLWLAQPRWFGPWEEGINWMY